MTGEERYNKFVEDIEKWVKCVGLVEITPNEDVENLLQTDPKQCKKLSGEDLHLHAYNLTCYGQYLQNVIHKEKIAVEWADDSIWYIISGKLSNYGEKYSKWQEKYYGAVKENPLALQLLKVKKTAEARVKTIEHHVETVKKLANILENLARRR